MLIRRSGAATVVFLAVAVGASGCSGDGDDKPKPDRRSADFTVPEGVTLTAGGSTLDVGQTASVVYGSDYAAATVVTVRIDSVERGDPSDLPASEDDAVPFTVRVTVGNAGPAELAESRLPLRAVATTGKKLEPLNRRRTRGCQPLPNEALDNGESTSGCLVYAVPSNAQFKAIRLRTEDLGSPVAWRP